MGDYVTALYSKYNTYYNNNAPILSPRTQDIGDLMQQRMDYNIAKPSGIIGCANEITVTIPATATTGARVPVTGVDFGDDTEEYAGQDDLLPADGAWRHGPHHGHGVGVDARCCD